MLDLESFNKKRALIFGILGQDGSLLSEFLLSKGYVVHGVYRSYNNYFESIKNKIIIEDISLLDENSVLRGIEKIQPDEIYNFAVVHKGGGCWDENIEHLFQINTMGVNRILNAILKVNKNIKFFQASSCEVFSSQYHEEYVDEYSKKEPNTPYGISKHSADLMIQSYRQKYGLKCCSGILFPHESERRRSDFFTKQFIKNAIKFKNNEVTEIIIGNIYSHRDWGYAKDYIEAMWLMLQHDNFMDFVISSNNFYRITDFIEQVFLNLEIPTEVGYSVLKIDKELYRDRKTDTIIAGDNARIKTMLSWEPKTKFEEWVKIMVKSELNG
jgi:GDPmannose 4,6-dehydratase